MLLHLLMEAKMALAEKLHSLTHSLTHFFNLNSGFCSSIISIRIWIF